MATVSHIAAADLHQNDTLMIDASIVIVDEAGYDDVDDNMWLHVTCISGNFDQFDQPIWTAPDATFRVLDAEPRCPR